MDSFALFEFPWRLPTKSIFPETTFKHILNTFLSHLHQFEISLITLHAVPALAGNPSPDYFIHEFMMWLIDSAKIPLTFHSLSMHLIDHWAHSSRKGRLQVPWLTCLTFEWIPQFRHPPQLPIHLWNTNRKISSLTERLEITFLTHFWRLEP